MYGRGIAYVVQPGLLSHPSRAARYNILLKKYYYFLMGHIIPPGECDKPYKPFRKSDRYDITGGRVHLDMCWIDQSTSLPS